MGQNLERIHAFDEDSLPDLDTVTLAALELFGDIQLPTLDALRFKRPLVVGSGNAAITGVLLFDTVDAVFADESSYHQALDTHSDIDGAYLISASGSKHAVTIAQRLKERGIETVLLTNNAAAPAREYLQAQNVLVFPKNREPYTYNTSTYMGMLLSKTHESPSAIMSFIEDEVLSRIPQDLQNHKAFFLIVPEQFNSVREMFETKFNELFGPKLIGRVFTYEQTKHAKTVVQEETELFVSFGVENDLFGKPENRLYIPLPPHASYVAVMAIGYVFIGHIQRQMPPYYKERIAAYTEETSKAFGSHISPIVE